MESIRYVNSERYWWEKFQIKLRKIMTSEYTDDCVFTPPSMSSQAREIG